jgi:threonine dehydrogenase-like Zn-dependent dehydrogenase
MRAAELISPLKFRLTDMPIEDPGPGEVQVRVESVGICGSDLHSYSEGAVGSTPNVYPKPAMLVVSCSQVFIHLASYPWMVQQ